MVSVSNRSSSFNCSLSKSPRSTYSNSGIRLNTNTQIITYCHHNCNTKLETTWATWYSEQRTARHHKWRSSIRSLHSVVVKCYVSQESISSIFRVVELVTGDGAVKHGNKIRPLYWKVRETQFFLRIAAASTSTNSAHTKTDAEHLSKTFWQTIWDGEKLFSKNFGFLLPVSLHRYSKLTHLPMPLHNLSNWQCR